MEQCFLSTLKKTTIVIILIIVLIIIITSTQLLSLQNNYDNIQFYTSSHNNNCIWRRSYNNLPSGWDDKGLEIYNNRANDIENIIFNNNESVLTVTTAPLSSLNKNDGSFRIFNNKKIDGFWDRLNKMPFEWEPETLRAFFHHIDSNTILIDFGTWIGPTVLYGIQYASSVYGIEGDPAAYAEAKLNIKLNSDKLWYKNIHIQPGCVCSKKDSNPGILEMKSRKAGNSGSGISQYVSGGIKIKWKVKCYTLEYLLNYWCILHDIINYGQKVFIKIDIESYECQLIPDFYNWLIQIPPNYLPTFFISYHPQIQMCTDQQFYGFAKIIKLYKFSYCYVNPQMYQQIHITDKTDTNITIFNHIKYCNSKAGHRGTTFTLSSTVVDNI